MKRTTLAVALAVLLAAYAPMALACRCTHQTVAELFEQADTVWLGSVANKSNEDGGEPVSTIIYNFKIERVFKGPHISNAVVRTAGAGGIFGVTRLEVGGNLILSAQGSGGVYRILLRDALVLPPERYLPKIEALNSVDGDYRSSSH